MSGSWDMVDEVLPDGYVIVYVRTIPTHPDRMELRLGKYNPQQLHTIEQWYERIRLLIDGCGEVEEP